MISEAKSREARCLEERRRRAREVDRLIGTAGHWRRARRGGGHWVRSRVDRGRRRIELEVGQEGGQLEYLAGRLGSSVDRQIIDGALHSRMELGC